MNNLRYGSRLITQLVEINGGVASVRHGTTRSMSGYGKPVAFKAPTLSELPIPQGSWAADHRKMDRKYNRHLILGVSFWAFTLLVLNKSGLVTLNCSIPKLDTTNSGASGSCIPPPKPKC